MSLKFTLGNSTSVDSGGRVNAVRTDDGAVVTSNRLTLEYSDWTLEGWARIEAWPKSGSSYAQMALLATNNAELLVGPSSSGGLRALPQVHVNDASSADVNYALPTFAITPSTVRRHFAMQFSLSNTRATVYLDGVVQAASSGLASSGNAVHVSRQYVGMFVNVESSFAVDPSTAPGVVELGNWRLSNTERHTHNTNFTPPTTPYSDTGGSTDPTKFIWAMNDAVVPYFVQSNFGREWGHPRISAFGDRYAGPWSVTATTDFTT